MINNYSGIGNQEVKLNYYEGIGSQAAKGRLMSGWELFMLCNNISEEAVLLATKETSMKNVDKEQFQRVFNDCNFDRGQ